MSETPTIQNTDQKSEQIRRNADEIINNPEQMNAFFTNAERQLAPAPKRKEKEQWDLDEPAQVFDPETLYDDATPYTTAPEQAIAPRSRAEEVGEPLLYRRNSEKVVFILEHGKGVEALRQAA
jgi:hypothetical protein